MPFSWTITSSPIGELLLAESQRGLARVAFECEDFEAVRRTLEATGEPVVEGDCAGVVHQLGEYFAGRRTRFDLGLDWCFTSGFRGRVQRALTEIPYGSTRSYGEVARGLGNPGAVRAVGTGCATNPIPVVVPCHRVVRSDGSLGNYLGGVGAKRHLLDLENGGAQ